MKFQTRNLDVDILEDANISAKEVEKLSEHKDLEWETSRRWNTRVGVIQVEFGDIRHCSTKSPQTPG